MRSDATRPIAHRLAPLALAIALIALLAPSVAAAFHPYRYPMKGPHNYGSLDLTGFGVKRSDGSTHRGQDIIADCGTRIVASHRAEVRSAGYSAGYGNYVVLRGLGTRFDFVYGHMKGRARVGVGKKVKPGQRIGSVGNTGTDSSVCHLHFELWKGRWFGGGSLTDPLPRLRAWDKYSGGPLQEEPKPPPGQYSASRRLYHDAAE